VSTLASAGRDTSSAKRNFRRLWTGQGVSVFGSELSILAIPTLAILNYHATAFEASVIGALQVAPFAIFSLPAGPLVDRFSRRAILIVCDAARAAAIFTRAAPYLAGVRHLWIIYGVTAVVGTFTVFFDIAYLSLVPHVVADDELLSANRRLSATNSAASMVGPALGGVLISAIGAARTVIFDSASYVASVISVALIRTEEPRQHHPEKLRLRVLLAEIREGLTYVARSPTLARIALVNAVFDFGAAMIQAVYLVFLYRSLNLTPGEVGAVTAVTGLSFFVGAILVPRVVRWAGMGRTLAYSIFAGGAIELLTPVTLLGAPLLILVGINIVAGATNALYDINQLTVRQSVTPDELQGRLHATMRMTFSGPRPFGFLLGGALATWIGTASTIVLGASVSTLGASILLIRPISLSAGDGEPVPAGTTSVEDQSDALVANEGSSEPGTLDALGEISDPAHRTIGDKRRSATDPPMPPELDGAVD